MAVGRIYVETVVEFGLEHCSASVCVLHMVVGDNEELIMAVHVDGIVIAGSDESCKDVHAALTTKLPPNILGELNWCTGCVLKRNSELGTLEITQKALVEIMLNRFGVNSSSDIPANPGVGLRPRRGRTKGKLAVQGGFTHSDVVDDHDTARYLERTLCCCAPFPQPHRQALESSSEVFMGHLHRTMGIGFTCVRGSGLDLTAFSDVD